jgi:hypothetical protein
MTPHVERDEQRCAPRVDALRLLPFAEWGVPSMPGSREVAPRSGSQAVTATTGRERTVRCLSGAGSGVGEAEADR